ncbi:MAG TPA: hypothetical protein PKK01_15725 [Mycobacterium sp.]|nr:hypothetical protein [Mycobacterium sp.]HPZ94542.1 hypothetical protein [Mycobacterium sp.]HQE13803.1 hypothetical protein [Mycobacterium sp.]
MQITRARRRRLGGALAGGAAVLAATLTGGLAACTSVTGGQGTVDAADAPAYRTSMSMSSSQAAASSSARESERQASLTTQAMRNSCETLATTSADAIAAVNAYVDAYNGEGGTVASTEGPAIDALDQSAQAVESSLTDVIPPELRDALAGWVDGAYAAAAAIANQASPSEFNTVIKQINDARSTALRMCDATYR